MKTIFEGYTKTGKPIEIVLTDEGQLRIVYVLTGRSRKFNDEYYSEDFAMSSLMRMHLLNDGFRQA